MTALSGRPVPSRPVAIALAVIGVFCAEYALWPAGDPTFDLAGPWSVVGNAFIAAFGLALALGVARPLYPRLREVLSSRPRRVAFGAMCVGSLLVWMIGSAELVVPPLGLAPTDSGVSWLPSLGPFGVLPTVEFASAAARLSGYVSPMLALYGLLAWLWSAAIALLAWGRPVGSAAVAEGSARRVHPLAASWLTPLGLGMSCCSPPVLLSAAFLFVAPGAAGASEYTRFSDAFNGLLIVGAAGLIVLGIALGAGGGDVRVRARDGELAA